MSPSQWRQTVTAEGLTQITVANKDGLHVSTTGTYFPMWLRSLKIALLEEVPDPEAWTDANAQIEFIQLPNGDRSSACAHHEFMLGAPSRQQINFANICFKDGLIESAQSSNYTMEFGNYTSFLHVRVPRTLTEYPLHGVKVIGTVKILEAVKQTDEALFNTPSNSQPSDPLATSRISTASLLKVAGENSQPAWPTPIPGSGMFTVWLVVDTNGLVRESRPLNSDESGFAASMAATFIGRHWKPVSIDGVVRQVEGPLVFVYPPPSAQ